MIELLDDVHMARGGAKSFGKVDFDALQAEWESFVKALIIQE